MDMLYIEMSAPMSRIMVWLRSVEVVVEWASVWIFFDHFRSGCFTCSPSITEWVILIGTALSYDGCFRRGRISVSPSTIVDKIRHLVGAEDLVPKRGVRGVGKEREGRVRETRGDE
jgi:hypothetical protein